MRRFVYIEFVNSLQVGNERVLVMSINDFFLHRIDAHDHPTQMIVSVLNSIEQMESPLMWAVWLPVWKFLIKIYTECLWKNWVGPPKCI